MQRADNQDSYGAFPDDSRDMLSDYGLLFVVADGMGGHVGGREASQIAVKTVEATYFAQPPRDVGERLGKAIESANTRIFERSRLDPSLHGMGTTCTTLVLRGQNAYLAHVGDSRAYRLRDGEMEQLTLDHSRVAELVRENLISAEDAAQHPYRNVLSRALGTTPEIEVDRYGPHELRPGDVFLLCSDGLNYLTDDEIKATMLANPPQAACDSLVEQANARGGVDNVTMQIVQIDHLSDREQGSQGLGNKVGAWIRSLKHE
jgi:protein phosphatase